MGKAVGFGLMTIVAVWMATIVLAATILMAALVALLAGALVFFVFALFHAKKPEWVIGAVGAPMLIYFIVGEISWACNLPRIIAGSDNLYGSGYVNIRELMVYFGAYSFLLPILFALLAAGAFGVDNEDTGESLIILACILALLAALPGGGIEYWSNMPDPHAMAQTAPLALFR